jgi:hypothetical protein
MVKAPRKLRVQRIDGGAQVSQRAEKGFGEPFAGQAR